MKIISYIFFLIPSAFTLASIIFLKVKDTSKDFFFLNNFFGGMGLLLFLLSLIESKSGVYITIFCIGRKSVNIGSFVSSVAALIRDRIMFRWTIWRYCIPPNCLQAAILNW